ncbi:MAG TPA: hypothetical protein DC049_06430, partial [Spirochaetia bacterium]|nr:hypothetical protein [Spirochaetia bacterium]
MKKFIFVVFGISLLQVFATRVALIDFKVNSDNPQYKYLGKGFSEMIAYEVKKAPKLQLVEREKRTEMLKEIEFSLTGLADEKNQLEAGKILACDYIIFGDIVDMAGSLVISLRMTRVESGEIVWREQLSETGKQYPYISAFFAKSILTRFGLPVDKTIEANLKSRKTKNAAAMISLSKGVDAYDKKDISRAKKELNDAKNMDPENAVIREFLNKLSGATSKFKVVPERYISMVNPAYLGVSRQDRLYGSFSLLSFDKMLTSDNMKRADWVRKSTGYNKDGYGAYEQGHEIVAGYSLPVAPGFGLGFEYNMFQHMDMATSGVRSSSSGDMWTLANYCGLYHRFMLTTGFKLGGKAGLGLGVSVLKKELGRISWGWGAQTPHNYVLRGADIGKQGWEKDYDYDIKWALGAELGLLFKNISETVLFDILAAYNHDNAWQYVKNEQNFNTYRVPIFLENTLTFALNEKRTYVVAKQINEYYLGRSQYLGKLMPALEQWIGAHFSIRLGVEASLINSPSLNKFGIGCLAGITPRIKIRNTAIDF